jgi:CRP-like cAMP-binding protein
MRTRRHTPWFTDLPVLADLPRNEHELLRSSTTVIDIDTGKVLCKQGDLGQEAMWLVSGSARVLRDDELVAVVLPGEPIGEIALLTEPRTRSATVVADSPVTVAVASASEFAGLMTTCPELADRMRTLAGARAVG